MFCKKEVNIMSWIKNKFNKLFKLEENEMYEEQLQDYYEEHDEQEAETHRDFERQTIIHNATQTRGQSFRFPLIDDVPDEAPKQSHKETNTTRYFEEDSATLKLPDYLQKPAAPQPYDGEVSGIRDLLERRRKGKGYSNVIRSNQDISGRVEVTNEEKELLLKNPMQEERTINKEFTNPLANRKRFIPTEVPSPVHGFLKPTPIEKLMEKQAEQEKLGDVNEEKPFEVLSSSQPIEINDRNQLEEETSVTPTIPIEKIIENEAEMVDKTIQNVEEVAPIFEMQEEQEPTIPNQEQDPILFEEEDTVPTTEVVIDPARYENVEAPPILVEDSSTTEENAEQFSTENLNDVQVKHVTIENSTIHIGQLNVEQLPQTEQMIVEQQPIPPEQPQIEKSGSRIPFNVVMLKSDKEKLLTKKFVTDQLSRVEEVTLINEHQEALEEMATHEMQVVIQPSNEIHLPEVEQTSIDKVTAELQLQPEVKEVVEQVEETVETTVVEEVVEQQTSEYIEQEISSDQLIRLEHVNDQAMDEDLSEPEIQPAQILTAVATIEGEPIAEEIMEITPQLELEDSEIVEERQKVEEEVEVVDELEPIEKLQEDEVFEEIRVEEVELQQAISQSKPEKKRIPYVKPPLEYLAPPEGMIEDRDWMDEQGENLVETLSYFQIQAQIESIVQGPAVTQFEITVGHGTKVSKVRNLADDIKLALAAKDIRIDAPIPGKRSIGIEIPNRISRSVRLSEVTDSSSFRDSDSPLEAALGLDLTGKPVTIDLRKMPHGLIAGATGSGKSVCINSILVSLLYKSNPNELKLMLIDPKMVELAPFNHIPHLVSPVITDVKAATAALKWAVEEMERRYQLFMHSGARKIEAYNKMCDQNGMYAQRLPYLLIVIDELADLMMMSPQDVEDSICRITQKARAAGIHLIVATQRPSVDVITGLIKSNIPTRIAFSVSSQIDSRTILDSQGAERLLGRGDMLYLGNGMSAPTRIQGTFVTDDEIEEIVEFIREQGEPDYIFQQEELLRRTEAVEEQDELFEEVCRFVFEQGSASTSLLQRRYHIGYNRAARLIDMLERQGYVSEPKGSKPRDVFITESDLAMQFGD